MIFPYTVLNAELIHSSIHSAVSKQVVCGKCVKQIGYLYILLIVLFQSVFMYLFVC